MRGLWDQLADLVLPGSCAGCGAEPAPSGLCEVCRWTIEGAVPRRVWPSPPPGALPPAGLPAVHAALGYAGETRAVLLAHKERGGIRLAAPLGAALGGAVRAAVSDPGLVSSRDPAWGSARRCVALVPVPSVRRAVAARGHDPTRRVTLAATALLRRAGSEVRMLAVLRHRRPVADQAGLTGGERLANLTGALRAVPAAGRLLSGSEVVLVDDLVTTGASLAEAARALREVGARVRVAAVIAARARGGHQGASAFRRSGPPPEL